MSIGAGIFLITAGAILAFGIRDRSDAVDLNIVGVVIMLAGGAGIWLSFYITNRRRRVETQALDPAVEEEYRTIEDTARQYAEASERTESAPPPKARAKRSSRAAAFKVTWPVAVTRKAPPKVDQASDTATERHVELDPAASGLHTPAPNRAAPVTSSAATPSPPPALEPQEPRSES